MDVLNGHHKLLSVFSLIFYINYSTIVNGVLVKLGYNSHRVALVYKSYSTISTGTIVR